MAILNDRVSEILKGFERVNLSREEICLINRRIGEDMKKSYYKHKKLEIESEERAKKIYITC